MNVTIGDNLNLPKLVDAAISRDENRHRQNGSTSTPKKNKNRNVAILSDNWTSPSTGLNHRDPNFLSDSFPRSPPKLYLTADTPSFDPQTLSDWAAEGFNVTYLPLTDNPDEYIASLRRLHNDKSLGPCETFGIIAFGEAAALCLEHYHVLDSNDGLKLGCLVGYYPTRIPDPGTRFPSAVRVVVHLAVGEVGVVKHSQMVGIQGKRRVVKGTVDRGVGVGGLLGMGYEAWAYEVEAGFAEQDLEEYDGICAELAWARSLKAVRRAFGMAGGGEGVVDVNTQAKFYTRDVQQAMSTYTTHKAPQVTYVSTLSGATGAAALEGFYQNYFMTANPPSLQTTLLSRTVGVDRVADELFVSFKHTQEMPWILPGVPPTNKRVEIVLVSIVTLKGGKLHQEHVYWDQASVLVQVGLLDPKAVPQAAKERGVERLPVVGKKAARWVFGGGEGESDAQNELIRAWEGEQDGETSERGEKSEVGDNNDTAKVAESKTSVPDRPKPATGVTDEEPGKTSPEHGQESDQGSNKDSNSSERQATVEDAVSLG